MSTDGPARRPSPRPRPGPQAGREPVPTPAADPPPPVRAAVQPADRTGVVRVRRRRGSLRRRLRRQRRLGLAMLTVGGLVVLGVLWVVVTGLLARRQLTAVQGDLGTLRTQVAAGDLSGARRTAQDIRGHADRAAFYTSGPAWSAAAAVPSLGAPFGVVRDLTRQTHVLGDSVLPIVVTATHDLDPATLREPDGRIDLARVAALGPSLARASRLVDAATASISAQPATTWLGPVDHARASFVQKVGSLGGSVRAADLAVRIAPTMLGQHGTRRYFVAFQNDAEARGTGGLPGAFAIARVSDGRVTFERFEPDSALFGVAASVRFGAQYDAIWGPSTPYAQYADSNVSPHFPYAARIWLSMWQAKTGERLDGALALDPQALSYLLAVTGPAQLSDATSVTSANVVALTQSDVYRRFHSLSAAGNDQRKQFLLAIARAVSAKVVASGDETQLVRAGAQAASERRLLVYSTDAAVERDLERTPLSGAIPDTAAPYAGLVVDNAGGNKLDYYLDRSLTYAATGCGSTRSVTVTIRLTNSAPAGLPAYVVERNDHPGYRTQPGDNREAVFYYATRGAVIDSLAIDGRTQPFSAGFEQGHPVFGADVELPRGATLTVTLHLTEPGGGAPTVLRQPLVRPLAVDVTQARCS